jgi:uncharacterized cupin superfamily protein
MDRPPFVRHYTELPSHAAPYEGDDEVMSDGAPLSRPLGLTRIGIHHELLAPGVRTSWPHAESLEEEFVYVLEGEPDVFLDGVLHRLRAGDCVAFVPGTGIAHTFINNTTTDVRVLVIGDQHADNRIHYPFKPEGWEGMAPERRWPDVPKRTTGGHDGLSDLRRAKRTQR